MFLAIILAVLLVADAVTTVAAIRRGAKEVGPLMKPLMARVGLDAALIITHVPALFAGFWLLRYGTYGLVLVGALDALYAFVVINNLKANK